MKRIITITIALVFILPTLFAQTDKQAYQLFDKNGEKTDYQSMINDFAKADVVFIGEYHNNPISHWMEYEITQSLFNETKGNIILGAEMFEADEQLPLTEYINDVISTARFEADTRLWSNYKTDYKPLVEFAKANRIPFIATNIPRRYADAVNKGGGESVLDSLSDEAKRYIAPLPIPFKADSVMIKEWAKTGMMGKNTLAIAKAQAVKDATMAYFIAENSEKGKIFIHFNGSFHSDNYDGIIYFLKIYRPDLTIKTLSPAQQKDVSTLENEYLDKADYILCVPETMTKTY